MFIALWDINGNLHNIDGQLPVGETLAEVQAQLDVLTDQNFDPEVDALRIIDSTGKLVSWYNGDEEVWESYL